MRRLFIALFMLWWNRGFSGATLAATPAYRFSPMLSRAITFACAIVLYVSVFEAYSLTYWIHTSGNDSNACASIDGTTDPGVYRLTITGAASCASSGDTIKLKNGIYTANMWQQVTLPSGTLSAYTTIEGESQAGVLVQPNVDTDGITFDSTTKTWQYIALKKMTIDGTQQISSGSKNCLSVEEGATNWLFEDLEIKNCKATGMLIGVPASVISTNHILRRLNIHDTAQNLSTGHGIYIHGQNNLIEYVDVHNNGKIGITITTNPCSSGDCTNNTILRNSHIHDNNTLDLSDGRSGVSISAGTNVQLYNNIIRNHRGSGISIAYNNVRNTKIYNNTLYNNNTNGGFPDIRIITGSGHIIQNNIIKRPLADGVITFTDPATGTTTSNLLTGTPTSIWANPSGGDFSLISTSPAINAGTPNTTYCAEVAGSGTTCDQGAFQTFGVPTGECSGNSFVINIPSKFPPLSGTTGWTGAEVAAGARTISNPTISGNQVTLTISGAAITAGQSCTVDYAPGNVKNCQDIGRGTGVACSGAGQTLFTQTNVALTNTVGGSVPVYTLAVRRFEYLNEDKGKFIGPENTVLEQPSPSAFRVCMGLDVTVAAAPAQDYKITWALNGGAATEITDVSTDTAYLISDTKVTNGDVALDNLTLGGSVFKSLGYATAPLSGPPQILLASGDQGNKCAVVAIKPGLTPADNIDFMLKPASGAAVAGTAARVTIIAGSVIKGK